MALNQLSAICPSEAQMKSLSRTRLLVLLAVGCSLLCMTGCLEVKETVTVYPSGAGTIHVYQKMGEQLSGMITGFAPSPDNKANSVESTFSKDPANWQGAAARTQVGGGDWKASAPSRGTGTLA